MRILYHFLFLIVALAILGKFLSSNKDFVKLLKYKERPDSHPYRRETNLFTPAERSFLGVLDQTLGSEYRVFGKVRLADLIRPLSGNGRQSALNRITSKHVDFVVCNAKDLSVIGVIELDDSSHSRDSRKERDEFVDGALGSAGVPIARFLAKAGYTLPDVRETIQRELKISIPEPRQSPPEPVKPVKVVSLCDFGEEGREHGLKKG